MSEVAGLPRMMNLYLMEAGQWIEDKISEKEALRRAEMGGREGDETEDEELSGGIGNGGLGDGLGNGRGAVVGSRSLPVM